MDLASLLSGIGSLGVGTLLGHWLSGRRSRQDARVDVISAVAEVERARWYSTSVDTIDPVRAAVSELEAAALRGNVPRKPVMLYGALAIASWRISEKDSNHQLWDEWADVVTDARDLVKTLVWQDGPRTSDGQRESDVLYDRARAVTRRSVTSVWSDSSDLRAFEQTYRAGKATSVS
jgi:hypothetical protein